MKYTKSKNEEVNNYIDDLDEGLKELFIEIRAAIFKTVPSFSEAIKWKNCLTYTAKKNAIQTVVGKEHITLIFFEGAQFNDDDGLLEGDGKKTRSYRVLPGKLKKAALSSYAKQAYTHAS